MESANKIEDKLNKMHKKDMKENNQELNPIQIQKRLVELNHKYNDLKERIEASSPSKRDKLQKEVDVVLLETKKLNNKITSMSGDEKESLKKELQSILFEGVQLCKEGIIIFINRMFW